jgi:hypothetical protein
MMGHGVVVHTVISATQEAKRGQQFKARQGKSCKRPYLKKN